MKKLTQLQLASSYTIGMRDFRDADLSGVNLDTFKLSGADFSGSVLRDCRAMATDFTGCKFIGSVLDGIHAITAGLRWADLTGASAKSANLTSADCRDSTFVDVDLTGAVLSGANFLGATLKGTDLTNAAWRSEIHYSDGRTVFLQAWPDEPDDGREIRFLRFYRWLHAHNPFFGGAHDDVSLERLVELLGV